MRLMCSLEGQGRGVGGGWGGGGGGGLMVQTILKTAYHKLVDLLVHEH